MFLICVLLVPLAIKFESILNGREKDAIVTAGKSFRHPIHTEFNEYNKYFLVVCNNLTKRRNYQ